MTDSISTRGSKIAKIVILGVLAVSVLVISWILFSSSPADSPATSNTDTRPDISENDADATYESVNQGGNPQKDTVPSPSGAGANTMLAPSIEP